VISCDKDSAQLRDVMKMLIVSMHETFPPHQAGLIRLLSPSTQRWDHYLVRDLFVARFRMQTKEERVKILAYRQSTCPRFEYRQNWHYSRIRLYFILSYFFILWKYLKKMDD
jgi:hypothetical protein